MASVATERIKREFMEVAKSEEVLNCISVLTSLCVGDLFDEKIGIADVNIRRNRFQIWSSRCRNFVAKCDIKVELINYNYTELCGEISGPPDTPYEGGNFVLEIKIPETYPFNPPKRYVVCDKDLASKHQFCNRSNMSGHSEGPMVGKVHVPVAEK